MSRFYIHVVSGTDIAVDPEGQELPDLNAARREAIVAAREIVRDRAKTHRMTPPPDCFLIADGNGRTLMAIRLEEAMS